MGKTLLIRADASVAMGTGHVMRMIALGQAWQDNGGEVIFLCAEITPSLEERLNAEYFAVRKIDAVPGSREDLEATSSVIAARADSSVAVALDGYQFSASFQLGLKDAGCRLLVVDDYGHASHYHADLVLNQNPFAREALYADRSHYTHLLIGKEFTLLRREFLRYRGLEREVKGPPRNVLVTMGGTDPTNVTQDAIAALADLNLEIKAVVGCSNPHLDTLRRCVQVAKGKCARVELLVYPRNMPELMLWADVAVAAGGSTAWELIFMGLPSVMFALVKHQAETVRFLADRGLALVPEDNAEPKAAIESIFAGPDMTADKLQSISRRCRGSLTGFGCDKVIHALGVN